MPQNIRPGIEVEFIPKSQSEASETPTESKATHVPKVVQALNGGYKPMKQYVEKVQSLLPADPKYSCAVCRTGIERENVQVFICPTQNCQAISDVICLSKLFLHQEQNTSSVLPTHGKCPSCGTLTSWHLMAKELSLRLRGQETIENLLKSANRKKANVDAVGVSVVEEEEEEEGNGMDVDDFEDDWVFQTYEMDDDESVMDELYSESSSTASTPRKVWKSKVWQQPSPIIEDSDSSWENAMLIS